MTAQYSYMIIWIQQNQGSHGLLFVYSSNLASSQIQAIDMQQKPKRSVHATWLSPRRLCVRDRVLSDHKNGRTVRPLTWHCEQGEASGSGDCGEQIHLHSILPSTETYPDHHHTFYTVFQYNLLSFLMQLFSMVLLFIYQIQKTNDDGEHIYRF